jgi:hypothetical protein
MSGARSLTVVHDRLLSYDSVAFSATNGFAAYVPPSGYSMTMNLQSNPRVRVPGLSSSDALVEDWSMVPEWWITWTVYADGGEVTSAVFADVTAMVRRPVSVPEPATLSLMALGVIGLVRRRRK